VSTGLNWTRIQRTDPSILTVTPEQIGPSLGKAAVGVNSFGLLRLSRSCEFLAPREEFDHRRAKARHWVAERVGFDIAERRIHGPPGSSGETGAVGWFVCW
jgi:hypothetical protein